MQETSLCSIYKILKNNEKFIATKMLEALSGRSWENYGKHRMYFNMETVSNLIGLKCTITFSTNKSNETKELSIQDASMVLREMLSARVWYDFEDRGFHSSNFKYDDEFMESVWDKLYKIQGKTMVQESS